MSVMTHEAAIGEKQMIAEAENALADISRVRDGVGRVIFGQEAVIEINGPSVRLSSLQATTFALIINELATNALKHGAMSSPSEGRPLSRASP